METLARTAPGELPAKLMLRRIECLLLFTEINLIILSRKFHVFIAIF